MATLANAWTGAHDVAVVTLASADSDFFELDRRVRRVGLGLQRDSRSLLASLARTRQRISALRSAIVDSGPDVVLSFIDQTNVLVLLATIGLRVPVIVSERVYPPSVELGPLWNVLRSLSYPRAARVVVQTERSRVWARRLVASERIDVLPNPIEPRFFGQADGGERSLRIVGMGRLQPQKGFDVLVRAFARIAPRFPDWRLVIAGEGPDRAELVSLAEQVAPGAVEFRGSVARPEVLLRESAVFALSSRFEGFPNALVEAMACGCAVIASDCPTGPAEIVRDGETGTLVPPDDETALATALTSLLCDPVRRAAFGAAAAASVKRFAVDAVSAQWARVLGQVAGAAGAEVSAAGVMAG